MASITPVSANRNGMACGQWWSRCRRLLCAAIVGLGVLGPGLARAEAFTVRHAETELSQQVYLLNAFIDYRFTEEVLQALNNGVPITLRLHIELQRKRRWWADEAIASLEQRFQLTFHAFSEQYLVRNLNSGALYTFPSLGLALETLGTLSDFPIIDAKFIDPGKDYEVELRALLDIEALPAPLRPIAYLTPAWRLSSDWYLCSLTH